MRKLLNTLFVTSEDAYLTIDGENVVVNREKQEIARFPLHTLSGIIAISIHLPRVGQDQHKFTKNSLVIYATQTNQSVCVRSWQNSICTVLP